MSAMEFGTGLALHYAPLLPSAHSLVWARHLVWSVVAAAVGLSFASRFVQYAAFLRYLPWVLALWAWMPGAWGLGYWLGLAFQIPSLSAAFLALSVLFQAPAQRMFTVPGSRQGARLWGSAWTLIAVLTGLLLLLDTFATFDFSIYQWGFTPLALGLALALALLPWVVSGTQGLHQPAVWSLLAALAVFLFTGWPTGNVWDAVLDPCLWLVAIAYLLRKPRRRA